MGILDDAIKEHLELKRQHGAAESELKQLEDEAFGAAERPGGEESAPDPFAEAPTEFMSQPDLGEGADAPEAADSPSEGRPRPDIADLQEPPEPPPASEAPSEPEPPAEEPAPAMEHETVSEPEPPAGPSTEERHAIAEQPTELFDVEEELAGTDVPAPSEEELVEEELSDADDFFDEKRLSDELDQALEAPPEEPEDAAEEAEESETEPTAEEAEAEAEEPPGAEGEEDVLEETPDFLEEAPEDDQLWFEQKPPKDFDFDD